MCSSDLGSRETLVSGPSTLSTWTRRCVVAASVLGGLAVATGTVVTGTGPHAGDERARRFGFSISHVARVHGISVTLFLLVVVLLIRRARRSRVEWRRLGGPLEAVMAVGVLQAAVGYAQYFSGIPAGLVLVHVLGATTLVVALTKLYETRWSSDGSQAIADGAVLLDHPVNDRLD